MHFVARRPELDISTLEIEPLNYFTRLFFVFVFSSYSKELQSISFSLVFVNVVGLKFTFKPSLNICACNIEEIVVVTPVIRVENRDYFF